MGHSVSVHRNFYRLQDSTIELAKVSRLLIAAEEGSLGKLAGKSLDEIELEGKTFLSLFKGVRLNPSLKMRPTMQSHEKQANNTHHNKYCW